MAHTKDNPKVYRDSFPFDRYVPHADFAAHQATLEEMVRGIGWVIEMDDHRLTFELREDTEWELRGRCAELEEDLRSRGIDWTPDKDRMDETNILRLEYRVPEKCGPGHVLNVHDALKAALEENGVPKGRCSWQVP